MSPDGRCPVKSAYRCGWLHSHGLRDSAERFHRETELVAKPTTKPQPLIGWREWVRLPELTATPIKAKIDTGARTSSLHAFDLSVTEKNGKEWAKFEIHPIQRSKRDRTAVRARVRGYKKVRSSTGHTQRRPVIRTTFGIGDVEYEIDVTLTSRDEMGFRMLLGRAAVQRRFLVDPGRSFLHPPPDPPKA